MDLITGFIISLTAVISAIGTLLITLYKTKKQVEESIPMKMKKQCHIDLEIISRMEELKEILNADRIQIYDFHNGGHYANGRSALKTTCTYEVVRVGTKGYQMELQGIPLSCISRFTKELLDEEKVEIKDIETIKNIMPATYHLKKYQGVKSCYDIILKNKNKEPIGFLAIQYTKNYLDSYNNNERNEILKLKFFIEENLEKMVENISRRK